MRRSGRGRFLRECPYRLEPDEQRAEREYPKPGKHHLRVSQRSGALSWVGAVVSWARAKPDGKGSTARVGSNRREANVLYSRSALPCQYEWVFAFTGGQAGQREEGLTPSRQPRLPDR